MKKALIIAVVAILLSTTISAALIIHPPAMFIKPVSHPNPPASNVTEPPTHAKGFNLSEYQFLDCIENALSIGNGSLSRLADKGFVVIPDRNASFDNFVKAYKSYYVNDLPVFITTDTILNVYHLLVEKVLETYEQEWIGPAIQTTVLELYNASLELYSNATVDKNISRDLLVTFAVPNLLFNSSFKYPSELGSYIAPIMNKINSSTEVDDFPGQDYTQYKVRGHYTKTEYLGKYFRAMIWLQRRLFSLPDTQALMEVWAISHLLSTNTIASACWEKVNTVLDFIVGPPDAMTYKEVHRALMKLFGTSDLSNFNETNALLLRDELRNGDYSHSRIISYADGRPSSTIPFDIWSIMGQRYVLDADVMQHVIYNYVTRYLPSGLDVMAALGSERAMQLLEPELKLYDYYPQLEGQRENISALVPDFWNASAYNMLLDAYKPLIVNDSVALPQQWMNSSGWRSEKLNTVLGSYAELKYDTILYAVQSYGGCSFPKGYVEPYPEFYERMARLCDRMEDLFGSAPLPGPELISYTPFNANPHDYWNESRFQPTFSKLGEICRILANISRTEIQRKDLTPEQVSFIQDIIDMTHGRGTTSMPPPVGWLTDLLRANHIDYFGTDSRIVADICSNANNGMVKEIGVGDVQTLVALVTAADGTKYAAAGPVYSYYEFEQPMTQRMTAEEWRVLLASSPPTRPDWAGDFVA